MGQEVGLGCMEMTRVLLWNAITGSLARNIDYSGLAHSSLSTINSAMSYQT